jgi:outer membrane protein assembly factor BamB
MRVRKAIAVWSVIALLLANGGAAGRDTARADEAFAFPPLKMPFPAGPGTIINGYDDGNRHTGSSIYSLDFCVGAECTWGIAGKTVVVAPTDLTLVYSGDYNNVAGDADDYQIFEIASSADWRLCMALGHFDLTAKGETSGKTRTFRQGDVLGTLLDYQYASGGKTFSIPHIHMGIWTVALADGCAVSNDHKRTAVAFDGPYAVDGRSFPIGGTQKGAVISTNTALAGGTRPATTGGDDEPAAIPIGDHPVERWRVPIAGQYAFSPAVRNGQIYLGTYDQNGDGASLLLDAVTGKQIQQFSSTGQDWSDAIPGPEGTIVSIEGSLGGSGHALVLALDAATGDVRWRLEPALDEIGGAIVWNDLLILSGGTYRGDGDQGSALAVELATGKVKWTYAPGLDDLYSPAVNGDTLYFGSFNTNGGAAMIALDAATGNEVWTHPVAEMWEVATPTIAGGLAVSGLFSYDIDNGGAIVALDLATGSQVWRQDPGLDAIYTPKARGTTLYAGSFSSSGNAALIAFDLATGKPLWAFVPPGNHDGLFGGSPGQDNVDSPSIAGDTLYVGVGTYDADGDGSLYALNPDGSIQWQFTPDPAVDVVFSPTLADGVAYVGTSDSSGAYLIAVGSS